MFSLKIIFTLSYAFIFEVEREENLSNTFGMEYYITSFLHFIIYRSIFL